jgi:glycosyltransferase involved in cell wall biosynthesis
MKIGILHYTSWPEIGGVEYVIRDQAAMLVAQGHEVLLMSGAGADPVEGYPYLLIEEISPDFPLFKEVWTVVNGGMTDANYTKYVNLLKDTLRSQLDRVEVTFAHNIFTMHPNLALTQALNELAREYRLVAWTHDLVATSPDYALPNPKKSPWSLMRSTAQNVIYVATSQKRKEELEANLSPKPDVIVIPPFLDAARLFNFTIEMRASLEALMLPERDFVFFLPAKIMPRKNIEFAIEVVKELKARGRQPLLLISAPPDPMAASGVEYGQFLRASVPRDLKRSVVFVHDFFKIQDPMLRDIYSVADCLLFPSRHEGFGLPLLEAAAYRIPIWTTEIPGFAALDGEGMFVLDDIQKLDEAVQWLESQPAFRLARTVRANFNPQFVYQQYYQPLLEMIQIAG